jgi:hypothetical protein
MRAFLGAALILCNCGEARSHGFWPDLDASARVPAEATVGAPAAVPVLDAGCIDCSPPADGGTCPATWAEASGRDAGFSGCPAVECGYPEGTCLCLWACGAGQLPAFGGNWFCTPVTSECPSPRPQSGTQCGDAGPYCHYGPPCCDGAWTMTCTGGVWGGSPEMVCP